MSSLLVSATAKEISAFLRHYRHGDSDDDIDVLISGIGLIAATFAITRQVHIKRPSIIVQAGLAGCFDRSVPLGTVLSIKQESVADLGVMEGRQFRTMFDLGLARKNQFPFKGGKLVNPHKDLLRQVKGRTVSAVSVNQVTTDPSMLRRYKTTYRPVAESMEGAALHYVALMENIPFVQVRAISNYAGERDKNKWNFKDALFNLNNEICRLFNQFANQKTQL